MSIRQMFQGSIVQPGLNPLVAPTSGSQTVLYTWGNDNHGKLGRSTSGVDVSSPVQLGSANQWSILNSSTQSFVHTGAIRSNGTLWMWGSNNAGRLGLGNTTDYSSPKQVGALTNWLSLSTGYNFSTAVKTDGTLWAWGANNSGQLGSGNTTNYSSPKQVGALTTWAWSSAGTFAMGAVKTDGTLWMWGGGQGQPVLGLGNSTYYSSPKQLGALTNWLKVYVGQYASFAVKTNGTLWSWGGNNSGQLGLGNTTTYSSPKQIGALTNWLKGAANGYSTAGFIKTDGTLWMWGAGTGGVLGLGNTTNYSSPKQVGALTNWSDIKMGYAGAGTFALKTDGTLWTWGVNESGCLGLGNTTAYSSPKQVGSSTNWTAIGNARSTVQAISSETITPAYTQYSGIWTMQQVNAAIAAGTWPTQPLFLYEWGLNTSGQLGTGNTTNYSSPKQIGSVTGTPRKFITKGTSTWLIKNDYSLWSWGSNAQGQLGLGNTTNYSSPKQIGTLTNWLDIASAYHAVAIKTDGTLWSWGFNQFGALGLGDTANRSSPVQVGALTTWSKVAVGTYHTLAVKADGTLWSRGYNASYQLGLGNATYYSSPKQVGALTNWLSVSASFYTSGAIKTDGTLWMWARNNFGQQGISSATDPVTSPRQVGALTTWSKIRCSGNFTTAIKTDGTLWVWGANTYGQLGTGNTTTYQSPVQVGALTTWSDVDVNNGTGNSTIAFKTDGTIWSWGRNQFGQLGLGNITNYSSPKQVGSLTNWLSISSGPYSTAAFPS